MPSLYIQSSWKEAVPIARRTINIHTLHHGTIDVAVTDLQCSKCRTATPYDGFGDAVFCSTNTIAFTRVLFDSWLHGVCATGWKFPDAFAAWTGSCGSSTAVFNFVGKEPDLNRQRANQAFSRYLISLRLPDDVPNELFCCSKCERTIPDGTNRMEGIFMNGSAAGILGELPNFQRVKKIVPTVVGVAEHQYLMPTPLFRAFIDSIFRSASKQADDDIFAGSLKPYLWENIQRLVTLFFKNGSSISNEKPIVLDHF